MSVSAIQNQYSSVNLGHSQIYSVGENLYWSSRDNKSEDFLDKNGNLDVKSLYELGKNQTLLIFKATTHFMVGGLKKNFI